MGGGLERGTSGTADVEAAVSTEHLRTARAGHPNPDIRELRLLVFEQSFIAAILATAGPLLILAGFHFVPGSLAVFAMGMDVVALPWAAVRLLHKARRLDAVRHRDQSLASWLYRVVSSPEPRRGRDDDV